MYQSKHRITLLSLQGLGHVVLCSKISLGPAHVEDIPTILFTICLKTRKQLVPSNGEISMRTYKFSKTSNVTSYMTEIMTDFTKCTMDTTSLL